MNILLVISDQLSALALPSYGSKAGRTPNIERILKRGAGIRNCYSPCPLCAPARAAFWTGRHPHETGVVSNGGRFPTPTAGIELPTIGSVFRDAGYTTVHFGKQHDSGTLRGFDCEPIGERTVAPTCEAWPVNYDTTQDRYATEQACRFLHGKGGTTSPFFCAVDLNNPHDICNWMTPNAGPHQDRPIPGELPVLPENFTDHDLQTRPLPVQYICCAHNRSAQTEGWIEANFRHYLAAYHHYVRRLDQEVGRLLDTLEQREDFAETLVIFMADHGDSMTAHRQVTKHTSFYEETTRVPLLAAGPGIPQTGHLLDTPLASLLDLMPTLCDLACVPCPAGLWGRSLAPWLTGARREGSPHAHVTSAWHTEWGFTVEPGRMLCTGQWKYIHYLEKNGEEFYDLRNDPGETVNLINNTDVSSEIQRHRQLLDKHLLETGDPYHTLTPTVDPRWRSHPPGSHHHHGPAAPMVKMPN